MGTSPSGFDRGFHELTDGVIKSQNEGILEQYLERGKEAAISCGARVCDVYAKWKLMYENGVDVTELLSNKINHPTHGMNMMFAYSLVEEMMK